MGFKMGLNGVDNAKLTFDQVNLMIFVNDFVGNINNFQ